MWCMCFSLMFWDVLYLGCCVPLTCQFAVELLQEAGLSGVAGEKSKADWVGTRLMVDLCLCGGKKKNNEYVKSCMKGLWVFLCKACMHLPKILMAQTQKKHASNSSYRYISPLCTLPWS